MCVTNTTGRRPLPVAFNLSQVPLYPTSIPQRLAACHVATAVPVKVAAPVAAVAPLPASCFYQQQPVVSEPTVPHQDEKPRPKRRRKPQKPGKTAKNNDRHFVVHEYHDHAFDQDSCDQQQDDSGDENFRKRGGISASFPMKLHEVLDQVVDDGLDHIISWAPHGRCFAIHRPKEFVDYVMPKYFRQTKLTSFQRQLNLYGFNRLSRGKDSGAYYNEYFLRGKPFLCKQMVRIKVKGTRYKAASNPEQEPDFYSLPPITPGHSDCEMSIGSDQSPVSAAPIYAPPAPPSMEPLSISYHSVVLQPQQYTSMAGYCQPFAAPVPYVMSNSVASIPPDATTGTGASVVLDDAVDELFFNQGSEEQDTLVDFCSDWDPSFVDTIDFSLNNNWELGIMLEKLLES